MKLNINNTFTTQLPADVVEENYVRQVSNACFSYVNPTKNINPKIIHTSAEMLVNIGVSEEESKTELFNNIFTGNQIYENTQPYAMCYAGHQFGVWAGQLGDGRAINLFEINHKNQQWAVQLKGAGKTPYSRNADGLAVLRSSVREYLCSEAMHYLNIPTTRALSLAVTGNKVVRDILYNGNPENEDGAIVCRVAETFLRFGNYEILAAQKDEKTLQTLVNYTINHFFPNLSKPSVETYLQFFEEVCLRTMKMVVEWERVGFVHGVMNTDNMSIIGLTIDFGPYGWIEKYDPKFTPNTTDKNKRYCFENQASIALWNLVKLANALYVLINDATELEKILNKSRTFYLNKNYEMMLQKLGLNNEVEADDLIKVLKELLEESEMDYTLFFRNLSNFSLNKIEEFIVQLKENSYSDLFENYTTKWTTWLNNYATILQTNSLHNRKEKMDLINPKYVLRNYMAQMAIDAANIGNYSVIDELYNLLKQPYAEQPNMQKWFTKQPSWAVNKIGCGRLSCSS